MKCRKSLSFITAATVIRKKVTEAVLTGAIDAGADAKLLAVGDLDDAGWAKLDAADGIIFGAPTYMGGPSADFKKFADASSKPCFAQQSWKDKIAAGFTNSAAMNGDKHSTIAYLITLAMQHGMIWAGTGMMPANTKAATRARPELRRRFFGLADAISGGCGARRSPAARRSGNGESVRCEGHGRGGAVECEVVFLTALQRFSGRSANVPGNAIALSRKRIKLTS